MATRSAIARYIGNSEMEVVYCHFDGDLNDEILFNHYSDEEKVKELISKGGMPALKENIKDIEFYGTKEDMADKFYTSQFRVIARQYGAEYIFLFKGGEWCACRCPEDLNEKFTFYALKQKKENTMPTS